ncbi:MAG: transposase, partial [Chlamydiae bacterium CG10_big_fil_rev_8_21_14_0_10_35_9]
MIIRKAYKFKLKASHEIEEKLSQFSGCCRFVWNKALALNMKRLEEKQPIMWYQELSFWLTFWKSTEEHHFLKDCHSQVLQQTLKNLERAFKDAFDKTQKNKRLPNFKRKFCSDSFRYPQGFKFENRRVFLPKIGWVSYRKSREIEGTPKNITVKWESDGWYFSVQTELEVEDPIHSSKSMVGIDMGISRFATLSTGEYIEPLNALKKEQVKLANAQRKLARQEKKSNNWKIQKKEIGKIHRKIRNSRNDFLHKTSTAISKNHGVVFVEALRISNMSASAKGTIDEPGKNVKAKAGLNRSILDQAWGLFRSQLEYKLAWLGGELRYVDPKYSSQRCPNCKTIDSENRKSQS